MSDADAWAVGGGIAHWDGVGWTPVGPPSFSPAPDLGLGAVATAGPRAAWVVGNMDGKALIERWDGSRWSVAPSPDPGGVASGLTSVAAVSPNDAWAVGQYTPVAYQGQFAVMEHWDGARWSAVPSPNVGPLELYSVAAIPGEAWAVGRRLGEGGGSHTLIEHWDGAHWSVVPSADACPGHHDDILRGVSVTASGDAWAVGYTMCGSQEPCSRSLIEHWDGARWKLVPSPNPAGISNSLLGVAAHSANDVWAVGVVKAAALIPAAAFIAHWDGTRWSVVPGANVPLPDPPNSSQLVWRYDGVELWSLALQPNGDIWAVGDVEQQDLGTQPLVEHYTPSGQTP